MKARLAAAGAVPGFAGLMSDTRYDRDGELLARDEVLRVREYRGRDGEHRVILGWKGPTGVSPEGYKTRRELEYDLRPRTAPPVELLQALGYRGVLTIDRYVEYFRLGPAEIRLEWYPRMDVLVEIEGDPAAIELGLEAVGIPRAGYTADALAAFVARYNARNDRPAVLAVADLAGEPPAWAAR